MTLKQSQRSLRSWTKQDWGTKSGKKSSETGERYLPKAARDALTSAEYAATSRKKREDTKKGKQHSKQPKKIARKTRQFRKVRYAGGLATQADFLNKFTSSNETVFDRTDNQMDSLRKDLLTKNPYEGEATPLTPTVPPQKIEPISQEELNRKEFKELRKGPLRRKVEKNLKYDPVAKNLHKFGTSLIGEGGIIFDPKSPIDIVLAGVLPAKAAKLPIQKIIEKNEKISDLFYVDSIDIKNLNIDRKKLTEYQKRIRGFSGNQIYLSNDQIQLVENWVQRSSPDSIELFDMLEKTGLNANSKAYLKTKFADKNDNITVYRYIHLRDGKTLTPERGVVSTSLNPQVIVNEARSTGKVTTTRITEKGKQEGYTSKPTDDFIDRQFAESEGLIERVTLRPNETVVLEYKVPLNKVKGYLPVVKESISESSKENAAVERILLDRYHDVEYKRQEYKDMGYDGDDIPSDYDLAEELTELNPTADIDYNLDADEFEVIADLKNLKPLNVYKVNDKTIELKK